jgi:hypothetical protein
MPSSPLPRLDRLAAHSADPGRACFADEAGIDFPALAVAVERMRHAFGVDEPTPAIDIALDLRHADALRGGDVSVLLPVRRTEERRDVTIALPRGVAHGDRLCVRLGGRHVVPTAVTLHVSLT